MNNKELFDLLMTNQRIFVLFFSVLFGVLAQEAYYIQKKEGYKPKNVKSKTILALFVCTLIGGIFKRNSLMNDFYPYIMMLLAYCHKMAAQWIMNDGFNFLISFLTRNKQDKNG